MKMHNRGFLAAQRNARKHNSMKRDNHTELFFITIFWKIHKETTVEKIALCNKHWKLNSRTYASSHCTWSLHRTRHTYGRIKTNLSQVLKAFIRCWYQSELYINTHTLPQAKPSRYIISNRLAWNNTWRNARRFPWCYPAGYPAIRLQ